MPDESKYNVNEILNSAKSYMSIVDAFLSTPNKNNKESSNNSEMIEFTVSKSKRIYTPDEIERILTEADLNDRELFSHITNLIITDPNCTSCYDFDYDNLTRDMLRSTAPKEYDAIFRYDHCLRVNSHALTLIQDYEKRIDPRKLSIVCICHDMCKFLVMDNHGKIAAVLLVNGFFKNIFNNPNISDDEKNIITDMLYSIDYHSDKMNAEEMCNQLIYLSPLMDSDILDKLSPEWIIGKCATDTKRSYSDFDDIRDKSMKKIRQYEGKTPNYRMMKNSMIKTLDHMTGSEIREIYDVLKRHMKIEEVKGWW